jgi:ribosomal protein S18 acetylase RimI-like enzyme
MTSSPSSEPFNCKVITCVMKIEIETSPAPADEQVIREGLRRHNDDYAPSTGDASFAVFLRSAGGAVRGGVLAKAGRGWLHIGSLWIDPALRRQGYGSRLMAAAEAEGRRRGCHSAYLDTFSFQAPAFYKRCGYEVFGILDAFPDEHRRFFMRKSL